jgi:branched-chain amino acid transport system substrate-binding protein
MTDGLDSPEMVKIGGGAVTGSYHTTVDGLPDAYPETAAFTKKFKQRFGREVESFGMYGYDATLVAIKAMEEWIKANGGKRPSRAEVSAAVRNIKNFKGITGTIQFDNKGDPLPPSTSCFNMTSRFIRQSSQSHRAASAGAGEEIVS